LLSSRAARAAAIAAVTLSILGSAVGGSGAIADSSAGCATTSVATVWWGAISAP
jgi:hypothetical protein